MRVVAMVALAVFLAAPAARAQQVDRRDDSHRVLKVLIGAGALVAGTAVAATSSKTTTVTNALGNTEMSEFSKSQLITGLVVAGTGGIILWDGLRDHGPSRPSTNIGVGVGRGKQLLFVRRSW